MDRDSAGPWAYCRTPIEADHEGICKFSDSDSEYQLVLSALKTLIAPPPVRTERV